MTDSSFVSPNLPNQENPKVAREDNKRAMFILPNPKLWVFIGILLAGLIILTVFMILKAVSIPKTGPTDVPITSPNPGSAAASNIKPKTEPSSAWGGVATVSGVTVRYPLDSFVTTTPTTLNLGLDKNKKFTDQETLGIEVYQNPDIRYAKNPIKDFTDSLYQKNSTASGTKRMITKPIEILINGVTGYEYYLESSGFLSAQTKFESITGKNRVIQFYKNNKHYIIFSSLDSQMEQVLKTLEIH